METYTPLTSNPVLELNKSQLSVFTLESIHAAPVKKFNPLEALDKLNASEGARVIGADFGGDKGITQLFIVKNGTLQPDETYSDYVQGNHGDGYLTSLEKTAAFASQHDIPVGISWGTPLDGTRPLFHAKATSFLSELAEKYDGDIANVVPTLASCTNDGPAGLISGVIEANRTQPTSSILFPINGGGIGMAALVNQTLFAAEAGHVEAVAELNRYHQTAECGVYGSKYVCLENLGANKAGIEVQWQAATGSYMRARDIEDQYKAGNVFAGELYDNSALIVAHVIAGTALALGIDLTRADTAIVGHGGAFKFPNYGARVLQIIENYTGNTVRLIMTKDYGSKDTNACLDGAALAALL